MDGIFSIAEFFKNRIVRQRKAGEFLLCELRCEPHTYLQIRSCNAHIMFVVRGSLETHSSQRHIHEEGAVVFHPIGESHTYQFSPEPNCILCIELREPTVSRLTLTGLSFSESAARRGGAAGLLGRRLFMYFRKNNGTSALAIEGLVLQLIAELLSRELSSDPRSFPVRAAEFIKEHYPDPLSLERLAAILGIHPVHLAKSFRRSHGCTVGEYIRRVRIDEASKRLISSQMSIARVAAACGYSDHSHLCRVFRAYLGVSPKVFRREHKQQVIPDEL